MPDHRWVKRNGDKPHRCPECHAVATWDREHAGPRTRLRCPATCCVQWRYGERMRRETPWMRAFLRKLVREDA